MKEVLRYLFLAAVATFLASSCKKDKEEPEPDPLIGSSWKASLHDDNPSTNPPGEFGFDGPNQYHPWAECQQDDTFTFGEDGTIHIDDGSSACENQVSFGPELNSLPYLYDRGKKEIMVEGYRFTIAEMTSTRLKLYTALPATTGPEYLVFLFKK